MGGVAALARELGHAVEGSDQASIRRCPRSSSSSASRWRRATRRATFPPTATRSWSAMRCRAATRRSSTCSTTACRTPPARNGCASTCCRAATRWPSPARTARPPPPRSSPSCSKRQGARPGFLVGGVPENFGVSARIGGGREFVVEADEYDTAFFDKRSQVRALPAAGRDPQQPRVRPRRHLPGPGRDPAPVPPPGAHRAARGRLIVNGEDRHLAEVLAMGCWTPVERFG